MPHECRPHDLHHVYHAVLTPHVYEPSVPCDVAHTQHMYDSTMWPCLSYLALTQIRVWPHVVCYDGPRATHVFGMAVFATRVAQMDSMAWS